MNPTAAARLRTNVALQDDILRAEHGERLTRPRAYLNQLAATDLRGRQRIPLRDEDVDLGHGVEVDEVERSSPQNGVEGRVLVHVEIRFERIGERLRVNASDLGDQVDVLRGAGYPVDGARDAAPHDPEGRAGAR